MHTQTKDLTCIFVHISLHPSHLETSWLDGKLFQLRTENFQFHLYTSCVCVCACARACVSRVLRSASTACVELVWSMRISQWSLWRTSSLSSFLTSKTLFLILIVWVNEWIFKSFCCLQVVWHWVFDTGGPRSQHPHWGLHSGDTSGSRSRPAGTTNNAFSCT